VSPDVLALYNIIETNFRPMSIVKDSMPHLETLTKAGGDVARLALVLVLVLVHHHISPDYPIFQHKNILCSRLDFFVTYS